MRIAALFAALALTALVPGAPLLAHVKLAASTPVAGAKAKAPKAITLTFSEKVNPAKATAAIIMTAMPGMANHGEMPIRNFTTSWSADGKTLTLTLKKPLPSGSYDVRWQAAAADGHAMTGKVSFDVG
ncbi:copper homeostasis periplasmic binding protein CopC [Porphyrobacter sp. ULC335]|uniref:copper homeostasis periplasmic binding protein CopC n=1 Tax=Porphyrobacter sp. ULC335 TaxID=2854260 RepID=UPI00221FB6C2|nr:copper homeostasis periplasmic binding protein CopC [Porphyrobacter sp. ULC335]UYV16365.1 copper homeostasis periplasmic binding protein CopC [Porphyrobacter sp. ULC335]